MLENSLENLRKRKRDIDEEFSINKDYSDKIKNLKKQIEEIDRKMGTINE